MSAVETPTDTDGVVGFVNKIATRPNPIWQCQQVRAAIRSYAVARWCNRSDEPVAAWLLHERLLEITRIAEAADAAA